LVLFGKNQEALLLLTESLSGLLFPFRKGYSCTRVCFDQITASLRSLPDFFPVMKSDLFSAPTRDARLSGDVVTPAMECFPSALTVRGAGRTQNFPPCSGVLPELLNSLPPYLSPPPPGCLTRAWVRRLRPGRYSFFARFFLHDHRLRREPFISGKPSFFLTGATRSDSPRPCRFFFPCQRVPTFSNRWDCSLALNLIWLTFRLLRCCRRSHELFSVATLIPFCRFLKELFPYSMTSSPFWSGPLGAQVVLSG